jgi:predicted O-methyltransferase YrrM
MTFDELKAMDWDAIIKDIENDPISHYSLTEWYLADLDKFIRLGIPRGSENGAIHHLEAIAILESAIDKSKFIVEIGTMAGVSTRLLGAIAQHNRGHVVSIDGDFQPGVPFKLESLGFQNTVDLVRAWVPWVNWKCTVPIDFLFIDGDHSLISVLVDYHFFNFFTRKGGIIAFHDCNLPEVQQAIELILKRDNLKEVAKIDRIWIYEKTGEINEKYYELLDHGASRNQLSTL